MIDFTLDLVPPKTTSQQKGIGRGHSYTTDEQEAVKAMYCAALAKHRPNPPLGGFIVCFLVFTWPWEPKHKAEHRAHGWYPKNTKPDWDNAAKGFVDCMETVGFFVGGDHRIFDGRCRKGHGDRPGIRVRLSEWQPGRGE